MIRDVKVVVKLKAEPIGTFFFAEVEMQEEKEEIVEVPVCDQTDRFFSLTAMAAYTKIIG